MAMKTFWRKMQNPFALVGQGFVLGGLLFLATQSEANDGARGEGAPASPGVASGSAGRD